MATARSHSVVPNPKISAEVRGSETHSRLALTDIHLASRTKTSQKKEITSTMTVYQHETDVWKKSSSDKQKESSLVWLVSTQFAVAFMCFGGPSLSLLFRTHPPSASHNHLAFIISPRLRVTGPSRRNYSSPFKSITS